MSNSDSKKTEKATQMTRPNKGEPVEIPVPSKDQIMGDFEKIAVSDSEGEDSDSD